MSATVSTPVIAVEVAELNLSPKDLEKKVRVPTTLPAKYGKFIQFGYFMMNKLNACDGDEDTPPLIDEQVFLNKMRIFEPLEDQQAFVEEFLESSKQINDELRKMMLQRKRDIAKAAKEADKPKKEKKPRQVKEKKSEESAAVPVEKKSKAKKVKVTSTEDALVNELVQLASGEPTVPPETPSLPVKETKPKSGEPTVPPETPSLPVKETKPKAVKETKPKAVKETKPTVVEEKPKAVVEEKANDKEEGEEDEEELQVSIFMYEGQQYLIDDLNNVYDFTSQDKIGSLVDQILVKST